MSVAHGGRADRTSRARARAANVVVPFPRRPGAGRLEIERLVPGSRAVLAVLAVGLVALVASLLSTATSVFAVRDVAVSGAPLPVAAEVRRALAEARGASLVGLDLDRLTGLVEAIPTVASVSFDRAFPHRLEVQVVPERVVGVVRQGSSGYLVSARRRVVASVAPGRIPRALPRIWAPRTETLVVGERVPPALAPAVRALAPLRRLAFPVRVASVRSSGDALLLRLGSGLEVRLGTGRDIRLKLTVAGRVLPLVAPGATYLDVSVPERPVAGSESAADRRGGNEPSTLA